MEEILIPNGLWISLRTMCATHLLGLDALLELVQENAQVARRIMEDVCDMIQLDYIEGIRSADLLQQTVHLIEGVPWDNDVRVGLGDRRRNQMRDGFEATK